MLEVPILAAARTQRQLGHGSGLGRGGEDWRRWDARRRLCDHGGGLGVALELGAAPPAVGDARRWRGEPVKALILPCAVFAANAAGFPVLPRSHQLCRNQIFNPTSI